MSYQLRPAPLHSLASSSSSSHTNNSRIHTRNDFAATLKLQQSSSGIDSNGSSRPGSSQRFGQQQSSSTLPSINNGSSSSRSSNVLSPSPPSSKPSTAATSSLQSSKPSSASHHPSALMEEKEAYPSSAASSAISGMTGQAGKDKDWNLWHGAVEAQWILSVLDDISNKLAFCSFLTPDILKDKLCDTLDPEMLLTLREHFQVENQYHEFLDSDLWKLNSHEVKNQELFHELDLCLSDSTRTVTRLLKQHPALVRRLRELSGKRSSSSIDFISTFSKLRTLMHSKLRMTAEEERHMYEQLNEYRQQEEEDTQKFIELTERLAVERNEHELALEQKEKKIQRLTAQIESLKQRTQSERQLFELKMREENDLAEKVFKQQEKEMTKQLEALQSQFELDGQENFRSELLYHRKKNLRALDVTNLIEKYDSDMQLKHESVVDMQSVYEKEKAELNALTGYFETRDEEERKLKEEHKRIHEERDRELIHERKQQQAGLLVQTLYQGYYQKVGPKEVKKKVVKKKKDLYAGLRGDRMKSTKDAQPASAAAASSSAGGHDSIAASPNQSDPDDSDGDLREQ